MIAWIESIAELMKMGHIGLDFSLSDARYLLPSAKVCAVLAGYAAFCLFCIWDNSQSKDELDQETDIESK